MLEDNQNQQLKSAIFKTIAFFDMFDYPLTVFEIYKYLYDPQGEKFAQEFTHPAPTLHRSTPLERGIIAEALGGMCAERGQIEEKNGLYFLKGREDIIIERMRRYNHADRKFKRALLVSRFFKFIPWIKMIAVANLIGPHNLKDGSDIDFFIVAEEGKIWTVRFFCNLFMIILKMRPRAGDNKDKICLSFFVSEKNLNLQLLMLESETRPLRPSGHLPLARGGTMEELPDIYFIYWLVGVAPIFNRDEVYEKFISVNGWIKKYLPNWQESGMPMNRNIGQPFNLFYRNFIDLIFGKMENVFKNIQMRVMPSELKEAMNKDSRVVIKDNILKMHVNDRRGKYRKEWREKVIKL